MLRQRSGRFNELQEAGCEIARVAVPDQEAVDAIPAIKKGIKIPLIADIHFHYQLALDAIKNGADGIRINPGNIVKDKIAEIVKAAKEHQTVIRIGVNAGSLQKDLVAGVWRCDRGSPLCQRFAEYRNV